MSESMKSGQTTRVSFHFHPYGWNESQHAVEKTEGGSKRRHLIGVSSGIARDLHGEMMTEKCIKSFQEQANSGDILLYEGQHGVNFVDDIGILAHSEITPRGEWLTDYRLYDELDGFDPGSSTLEKADKLWKQVNGLKPYSKPKQKGFSIEGEVPDNGIVEMDGSGRRVMNDVLLDGVVVVPRPAYKDSIASAVYKALGVLPPDVANKVQKGLRERLSEKVRQSQLKENFYQQKFLIEDELDSAICEIVNDPHETTRQKLEILFSEYSDLMIDLILQNEGFFQEGPTAAGGEVVYRDSGRMRVLKQLESAISMYQIIRGGSE